MGALLACGAWTPAMAASIKNETVYATLEPDGTVKHQTVSTWLVEHIAWILNGCLGIICRPVQAVGGKFCKFVRLLYRFCKKKLKNGFREFIIILFS